MCDESFLSCYFHNSIFPFDFQQFDYDVSRFDLLSLPDEEFFELLGYVEKCFLPNLWFSNCFFMYFFSPFLTLLSSGTSIMLMLVHFCVSIYLAYWVTNDWTEFFLTTWSQ